jgi:hypothetical protein
VNPVPKLEEEEEEEEELFEMMPVCEYIIIINNFISTPTTTYELLTNMIFHISVEKNYKSYLSLFW